MIKNILVTEDYESSSISILKTLEEMGIRNAAYVYYCDDALVRVQLAKEKGDAYDLLITDLSFDVDHRKPKIGDGTALIRAVRAVQPELRVLVFSVEGKPGMIEKLYNSENIDGYVRKGRNDAKELKMAIQQIARNERYFPQFYLSATRRTNAYSFSEYDLKVISLMAEGKRQKEISNYLKENGYTGPGLSSVEKRLHLIREALQFSNNQQLVAYCKEQGLV